LVSPPTVKGPTVPDTRWPPFDAVVVSMAFTVYELTAAPFGAAALHDTVA
jgi:hypothetical protein